MTKGYFYVRATTDFITDEPTTEVWVTEASIWDDHKKWSDICEEIDDFLFPFIEDQGVEWDGVNESAFYLPELSVEEATALMLKAGLFQSESYSNSVIDQLRRNEED